MDTIAYKGCKTKIEKGNYESQEEMQIMLDVFYMGGRITQEPYEELSALLVNRHIND